MLVEISLSFDPIRADLAGRIHARIRRAQCLGVPPKDGIVSRHAGLTRQVVLINDRLAWVGVRLAVEGDANADKFDNGLNEFGPELRGHSRGGVWVLRSHSLDILGGGKEERSLVGHVQ